MTYPSGPIFSRSQNFPILLSEHLFFLKVVVLIIPSFAIFQQSHLLYHQQRDFETAWCQKWPVCVAVSVRREISNQNRGCAVFRRIRQSRPLCHGLKPLRDNEPDFFTILIQWWIVHNQLLLTCETSSARKTSLGCLEVISMLVFTSETVLLVTEDSKADVQSQEWNLHVDVVYPDPTVWVASVQIMCTLENWKALYQIVALWTFRRKKWWCQ